MSAEVFEFRPFQNARNEASKLNPKLIPDAIDMCREEQRKGHSGLNVSRLLQAERLARTQHEPWPTPPQAA